MKLQVVLFFCVFWSLSIHLAFAETPEQVIVRESYEILNGPRFTLTRPTRLSDLFEKRVTPQGDVSFYSTEGVSPGRAVEQLFGPHMEFPYSIECNIASTLVQYRLLIAQWGGVDAFDRFSTYAATHLSVMSREMRVPVFPQILLGNRFDRNRFYARDLLLKTTDIIEGAVPSVDALRALPVGTALALSNYDDYEKRHPQGSLMGQNIVFYGVRAADREPLYYGFKGIFADQKPHTLQEIWFEMLEDYLSEPGPEESESYARLDALDREQIEKRIGFLARPGLRKVEEENFLRKIKRIRRVDDGFIAGLKPKLVR